MTLEFSIRSEYKEKLTELLKAIRSDSRSWASISRSMNMYYKDISFLKIRGLAEGLDLVRSSKSLFGNKDQKQLTDQGNQFLKQESDSYHS